MHIFDVYLQKNFPGGQAPAGGSIPLHPPPCSPKHPSPLNPRSATVTNINFQLQTESFGGINEWKINSYPIQFPTLSPPVILFLVLPLSSLKRIWSKVQSAAVHFSIQETKMWQYKVKIKWQISLLCNT
jgi:hypothetical protein